MIMNCEVNINLSIEDFTEDTMNNICRTCLCQGDMFPLYEKNEDKSVSIYEMLLYCTFTEFEADDDLPKQICSICLGILNNAYKFATKCETSHKKLLELKSSYEIKIKNVQSISTDIVDFENVFIKKECESSSSEQIIYLEYNSGSEAIENNECELLLAEDKNEKIQNQVPLKVKNSNKQKKSKSYKCKICVEQFNSLEDLSEHRKSVGHPVLPKKVCKICGKSVVRKAIKKHLRIHTKEKPYTCEICGSLFSSGWNLRRHFISKHSETKPHNCNLCEKGYASPSILRDHIRTHTGEKPYICDVCGKGFSHSTNFHKHLATHNETGGDILYQCQSCDRSFDSKFKLKAHSLIHGEKKYLCQYCGRNFVSTALLQSHLKIHSGEKNYICHICNKAFSRQSALCIHMFIHNEKKPHKCKVCGKQFRQSAHLKYHSRIHSGEKPFSCEFCGKSFAQNGTLTVHKRIHTGETPYQCQVCNKGFYASNSLKKHKKSHPELTVT